MGATPDASKPAIATKPTQPAIRPTRLAEPVPEYEERCPTTQWERQRIEHVAAELKAAESKGSAPPGDDAVDERVTTQIPPTPPSPSPQSKVAVPPPPPRGTATTKSDDLIALLAPPPSPPLPSVEREIDGVPTMQRAAARATPVSRDSTRVRRTSRILSFAAVAVVVVGAGVTFGTRHMMRAQSGTAFSRAQVGPLAAPATSAVNRPARSSSTEPTHPGVAVTAPGVNATNNANDPQRDEPSPSSPARSSTADRHGRTSRSSRSSTARDARPEAEDTDENAEAAARARRTCIERCNRNANCLVDCMSDGSRGGGPNDADDGTDTHATLPATPPPEEVRAALGRLESEVAVCSPGPTSWAVVDVTFASSGRVTTALVRLPHAGTPVGSCVARVVHAARVPPFTRPSLQVAYTYRVH